MKVRVGTRRSRLARAQTEQLLDTLRAVDTAVEWAAVPIETTGDVVRDVPLRDAGGKGLFVKELDEALLEGSIDCAVHSLKDVPTDLPAGVRIGCIPRRADARDVLLSRDGTTLERLDAGAVVGTTSLRRAAQLCAIEPGLRVEVLRGNVETRLRRLVDGDYDLTLLAAAGLSRLGIDVAPARALPLDPYAFVPAPGQGALAVTVRAEHDATLGGLLGRIADASTWRCADAERAAARVLGGSCHLPVAAYAELSGAELRVVGLVASPDGRRLLRDESVGALDDAEALGESVGRRLLAAGGAEIVEAVEAEARARGVGA